MARVADDLSADLIVAGVVALEIEA